MDFNLQTFYEQFKETARLLHTKPMPDSTIYELFYTPHAAIGVFIDVNTRKAIRINILAL